MKIVFYSDQIFCVWLFYWALLSALFPNYFKYYPTKVVSIIIFISGIINALSPNFDTLAKILILIYHSAVLVGYFLLKRRHSLCMDILIFVIYILYTAIKYKKSPYDVYLQFFYPVLEKDEHKVTGDYLLSFKHLAK